MNTFASPDVTTEVAIIGAGISGSTAALDLLHRGHDDLVVLDLPSNSDPFPSSTHTDHALDLSWWAHELSGDDRESSCYFALFLALSPRR